MNALLQHPFWYVVAGTFIFLALIGWVAISAVAFVLVRELVAARLLDPAALAGKDHTLSSLAREGAALESSGTGDRGNGSLRQVGSDPGEPGRTFFRPFRSR